MALIVIKDLVHIANLADFFPNPYRGLLHVFAYRSWGLVSLTGDESLLIACRHNFVALYYRNPVVILRGHLLRLILEEALACLLLPEAAFLVILFRLLLLRHLDLGLHLAHSGWVGLRPCVGVEKRLSVN